MRAARLEFNTSVQGPFKDTNERRGHNGQNGPCWDGLLGVFEVPRAVGSCHDPCKIDRSDSDRRARGRCPQKDSSVGQRRQANTACWEDGL